MPPTIALFLCILFILCVFIIEFKRKPDISIALWIPLIWIIIVGSRPVSHWINAGPVTIQAAAMDYITGNPINRTVLLVLLIAGLSILSGRKMEWSQILESNGWMFLWFLYCGLSILWSDFPGVAFRRWFKGIGALVIVLVVLTSPNCFESIKTLIKRCSYVLIPLSLLLIKYYPHLGTSYSPWGHGPLLAGVTTDKNALGRLCLVCGFFFFYNMVTMYRNKNVSLDNKDLFVHILFSLIILWLLIAAHSATALGSLIIGICIFIGLGLPIIKRNIKHIGIFIFLIAFIVLILQQLFDIASIFVTSLERDMTFTNRTGLWKDLIDMGTSPLLGTGYESFWLGNRLTVLWEKYWWMPNEAHNGYLETYLELGFVGLFLLTGIILSTYRKIRRTLMIDFDYGIFRMTFLIMILLYNVTESAFKGSHLMWFVFLLIAVDCPHRYTVKSG